MSHTVALCELLLHHFTFHGISFDNNKTYRTLTGLLKSENEKNDSYIVSYLSSSEHPNTYSETVYPPAKS